MNLNELWNLYEADKRIPKFLIGEGEKINTWTAVRIPAFRLYAQLRGERRR